MGFSLVEGNKVPGMPFVYRYQNTVYGLGFAAQVTVRGKALGVHEGESDWWMYGVQPGSLSAGGTTASEATASFRNRFWEIVSDLAEEATSLDDFKRRTEEFAAFTNRLLEEDWWSCVEAIRLHRSQCEEASSTYDPMPQQRAEEIEVGITVRATNEIRVEEMTPARNLENLAELAKVA